MPRVTAPEVNEASLPTMIAVPPGRVAVGTPRQDEPLTPSTSPYDPAPQRERLRGWLASGLTILLAVVILLAFVSYWRVDPSISDGQRRVKDIIELLQVVFGPLATLVGTVIGFYFGGKRE